MVIANLESRLLIDLRPSFVKSVRLIVLNLHWLGGMKRLNLFSVLVTNVKLIDHELV